MTGAPLAIRTRSGGSVDSYAVSVGRWLVTRDGFDFFLYYLPDYDYASHTEGPEGAGAALARTPCCAASRSRAAALTSITEMERASKPLASRPPMSMRSRPFPMADVFPAGGRRNRCTAPEVV